MGKYAVIGGQYDHYCHGTTPTLLGAKRLARKSQEYWDNWQGWHTPSIYAVKDCRSYGYGGLVPKIDALPVAVYRNGQWCSDVY